MKRKDILLKINEIKNKLNKAGHTANKILITNESGEIETTTNITTEDLNKLDGIKENIQGQIDSKLNKESLIPNKILTTDELGAVKESELDREKLNHLTNVNRDIQEQIEEVNQKNTAIEEAVEFVKLENTQNAEKISEITTNIEENNLTLGQVKQSLEEESLKISSLQEDFTVEKENIFNNTLNISENSNSIQTLKKDIEDLAASGGDTGAMFEIKEAKGEFATLKEKLSDIENRAEDTSKDIEIGAVGENQDRKLEIFGDEGEVISTLSKDYASFSKLEVGEFSCVSVISKQNSLKLYVNGATGDDSNDGLSTASAFKTINRAINYLNKYLVGDVIIYAEPSVYNEKLIFEGFCGLGSLYLYLKTSTLNGDVWISSCTTPIKIYGQDTSNPFNLNHTTSYQSAFRIHTSPYVYLQYCTINGNTNTKYGVEGNQGGGGAIKNTTINGTNTAAIVAYECSSLYVVNCKGSNNTGYSIYSASGSTTCIAGTIPDATKDNWNTTGIIHGTATKTTSDGVANVPVEETTKKYTTTKQISYRGTDGWSRTNAYQGRYDSKNSLEDYNHYGCYVLDSATMRTDLKSKTIKSVNVKVKRATEGQGLNQPTTADLCVWSSTTTGSGAKPTLLKQYTTVKSVIKGQTVSFNLPVSMIADVLNNNVNSLVLYTTDGSSYCKMDTTFELEVVYV